MSIRTSPSRLGQHRVLAPNARFPVSPLQLGGIGVRDNWECGAPAPVETEAAFELLDAFYNAGGNFIDTAHDDRGGLSEECVGEWAKQRGVRNKLVIATKCSASLEHHGEQNIQRSALGVNSSMALSLEASLNKLRTSYVDIFYVDICEWNIPVEEVMNDLHALVVARKVLYLGLSNTPSWICSKANMYARIHGKTPFVIYQGYWNVLSHTFARDIVPMAQAEGMALALRNIITSAPPFPGFRECDLPGLERDRVKGIFRSVEDVAKELHVEHVSAVFIAYILHKFPHVFPVIMGQTAEQLFASIKGLDVHLSSEQISYLESVIAYERPRVTGENEIACCLSSETNGSKGIAVSHLVTPEPVDATAVACVWLKDFIETTASGNADNFATKLFQPDGWFRDLLVFSWDNRTLHGHYKIVDYLERRLASTTITNVVLDDTPALRPCPFTLPFGQGIELSFRFETPIAFARGLARLLPMDSSDMKALSLFIMMEDLKGSEESEAESGLYGGHTITWSEVLEQRRSKVESDPQVVIIGGGQSGLHTAARLKQMNISALVVEKNQRIGDNWRKRYPSLTLHTPKIFSTTLYQPFPRNFPLFIPRDKIADWLEYYAIAQDLVVWTNSQVLPRATYDLREKRWTVQIDRNGSEVIVRPKHVVVATGVHGFPYIPYIPHIATFRGEVLHTSQFPGGQRFAGLRVVVIGAGNSSADICQDLSFRGAASVTMIQRSMTCVVSGRESARSFAQAYPDDRPIEISDFKRAAMPLAMVRAMVRATAEEIQAPDKEMLDGLRMAGFQHYYGKDNSGPGILYFSRGGGYWLDVGCAELIATGKVAVRQGVQPVSFTATSIVFDDGSELQADAVIFATGYTSWRDRMKDIFDLEVLQSTKEIWGLDEEDEMCGVFRPTGYPAFWYAAGDLADSRFYSKQLALHIKAEELNLKDDQDHSASGRVNTAQRV